MEDSLPKTLGLAALGAFLGALVMKFSMPKGAPKHEGLGNHLLAAGSGLAVGATAMHLVGEAAKKKT